MKDISPQRWLEIEPILDEALDADPADREGIVDRLSGDDQDLKAAVMSLLKAGDRAEDFLEKPGHEQFERALVQMAAEEEEAGDDPHLNRKVGPYRLIRRLGRGGMGQVYLGSRDEDDFDKFVAVKLIRRGMDTDEILQRFRTERRILASLVHPNIARLLDGGATEDGLSYFVMDYVDGKTITEYSDDERLSVRDRLRLFQRVCSAVHYAHQNLIVHRDLKPSNILVDESGDVKLLDFGIAKFLHPGETDFTVPVTREEARVMTPEYASPEQARGEAITTASDVYQLGILLYELLTGTRPYDFSNERRAEIERIICETEPERPSTAVATQGGGENLTLDVSLTRSTPVERLKKQLSGDLDRIVLMALRKEADRRYQSADQFLEDINRYLSGLPVHAQADTWVYRASKFARRHRMGVAATLVVAMLLVAITVVAVRAAYITQQHNEQIRIALAQKNQVTDMMIGMFEVGDPEISRGREITARELLERSTDRIEYELEGQPEVQAEMLHSVGTVYLQLGLLVEARPLIEQALEIRRELHGNEDNADLAQSLFDLARWHVENGTPTEAESLHVAALQMRRQLFDPPHLAIAASLHELGVVEYEFIGDLDETERLWRESLAMREELEGPESRGISENLVNLANVLTDRRDYESAETYYRQGLAMQRKLLGDDHPFVASTLYALGALLADVNKLDEAGAYVRESLNLRRVLYGDNHSYVATALTKLGQIEYYRGAFQTADSLLTRASVLHESDLGSSHPRYGRDLQLLGLVRSAVGDNAGAISILERAISIFPDDLFLKAEAQTNLAEIFLNQDRATDAEELLRPALALYSELYSENSLQVSDTSVLLARALYRKNESAEAERLLSQSLEFYESGNGEFDDRIRMVEQILAQLSDE